MGRKPNYPTAKAQCECGATKTVPMETAYNVGYVMMPYPGGGDYGKCLRCRRTGRMKIVEIPQTPIKKPVGWSKISKE
jgi:hypothetical protein